MARKPKETEEGVTEKTNSLNKALELVKQWEGFHSRPYRDIVGVATIGYGLTAQSLNGNLYINKGYISQQEAEEEALKELDNIYTLLNLETFNNLNSNQKGAILSLAFNVGVGAISQSTLLRKVKNQDDMQNIADEFSKWRFAGGRQVNGLINRRKHEQQTFLA